MAPKKFSEKLDEQIERIENMVQGEAMNGKDRRTLSSISRKLVEIKERLVLIEDNKGIKRVRISKSDEKRDPSKYQVFVREMSKVLKDVPEFSEFSDRATEIGRLWKIERGKMNGSDVSDSDDEVMPKPKSRSKAAKATKAPKSPKTKAPKAATKAPKAPKATKATKAPKAKATKASKAPKVGGFYEEAYY